MSDSSRITLECPCCRAELVVDAATGALLSHKEASRPAAEQKSLDSLLAGLDEDKSRREDVFEREVAAHNDRDRLLEEKFAEAMRRAEEEDDETPPVRPFDLD